MRSLWTARSHALLFLLALSFPLVPGCATSETGGSPAIPGDESPVDAGGSRAPDATNMEQDSSSAPYGTSADSTMGDDSSISQQDALAAIDAADAPTADAADAADAADETAPADTSAPDGGARDDSGVPSDSAGDSVADATGGQDGSLTDASDAGLDAREAGADANAGSDASDARADANDAASDAQPMCAANVLIPIAVVASSANGAGVVASNTIDGIFTTRWESIHAIDPQWIYLDFGAPVFVSRVQIAWETACASNYAIQVSNDAAVWTTLTSVVGNIQGGPAPADWTTAANHLGLSGVGRYVRINGTVRCTMYGYSMWEMRVFGDTNSTCHP